MVLFIDPSWTYHQAVIHLQTLKLQYEEVLASFSYFQLHERTNFIRSTRNQFYALSCLEWQKDRMWNYMNGSDDLFSLLYSASKYK